MQKILVPTDFSELSENALQLAVDIGRRADAEIFLVHFMDHPFGDSFSVTGEVNAGGSQDDLFTYKLAKRNHERLAATAAKHGISVPVKYQVYDNEFEKGFKKYIREQAIDLVVIATSGEESAEEFFTGNHAEQMINGSACPVISVKGDYKDNDFKRIVVGIDLEMDDEDNYLQAATYLNNFAKDVSGKLHLVHVTELDADKEAVKKEVAAFVDKVKFKNYELTITQNDDKEQALMAYCFSKSASMLAVLTHAESGILRLFTESTAEELSKKSTIPVMSINLHNI